jgi:transcriptional regulator with XRE-family HTH domain
MPQGTSLGGTVRKLRLKADFTLRALSRRVGISCAHQSDIEHGRRMPSDDLLRRIAKELAGVGATYEDLRLLKPSVEEDLVEISKTREARELLREAKESGHPVREVLKQLRDHLRKSVCRD